MARRRPQHAPVADPTDKIIAAYRRRLAKPAKRRKSEWQPALIGPTWQTTDDGHWLLPEITLGWEVLGWCGRWLQHQPGRPWKFTDEQARFILWFYAIDDSGEFLYTDAVLQRLKGWGKDPLGACICLVELLGPCRFGGWDTNGDPVVVDRPNAWVQIAAVSLEQTKNTMRLMPGLITAEARKHYRIQIGKEQIYALHGERFLQAVTSSPATLEGARGTFVLMNETQHWTSSNEGHDMADVIERNTVKSEDGAARNLRITNAYEPGEDSVAQRDREAFEAIVAGLNVDTGLLYDSIEADPKAPLTAEAAPSVVESIRGDSVWLSIARIVRSILDPRNDPSRSRRFWYNQITATADAWVAPAEWDALALELVVADNTTVTLGFDGSKSDDHCALIGSVVAADHLFEIGVWEPRCTSCRGEVVNHKCRRCHLEGPGEVDREDIDRTVRAVLDRYDVVGFYSDLHPWESYVDRWAEDFGEDLVVKAGPRQPIAWDIRSRNQPFTVACERLHAAIVEAALSHCGSTRFRQHVHNARRAPNNWGISVRKENRESARKIDSVPAAVLARLARQDYLALPESRRRRKKKRSGVVWGA